MPKSYEKSLELFNEIVQELAPSRAQGFYYLAMCSLELEDYENFVKNIHIAYRHNKSLAKIKYGVENWYDLVKRRKGGEEDFMARKAVES